LRFNNTVRNLGPGRLEIQGNPKPPKKREPTAVRDIYQNLYDAPVGGTQVAHLRVHADTIYHAGHHHFHFANFAEYLLVKQDGSVQKQGSKTSFCIMDTTHFTGSFAAQYQSCGGELQGLTTGWGDTYDASLVDQWVVLGKNRLADGEYTLQSTADPGKKLVEADETNNIAVTSFTVNGGGQIITIH